MNVTGPSGNVLIAVTHLLGSGHLVRAAHLARALADSGFAVTLASGGMPLRGFEGEPFAFVQLPPVKTEGVDFRNLLDEDGQPIDPSRRTERQALLAGLATSLRPDVVITEHFPFGRRQLAGEFLGLIAAARAANPKALVLSSVRDVLVTPRPERIAEAERRLNELFDAVLVHGDRSFLPLEASWPVSPELAGKLHYTGYLASPVTRVAATSAGNPLPKGEGRVRGRPSDSEAVTLPPAPSGCGLTGLGADTSPLPLSLQERGSPRPAWMGGGSGEILVSGGGSGAALPLFQLCIEAARVFDPSRRWRILVGRGLAEPDFAALRRSASPNVTVEWSRPDFPQLLAGCALSISQAGYNTVLDLVAAGRPAMVVPFDEGAETEQAVRAEAMERAGLARCLRLSAPDAATPAAFAATVEAALQARMPGHPDIDRDGAGAIAGIVGRLLAGRA
ncbi:MAG TPA: glycosyltransferase [Bosea sp. (in: a-proteobacteria)]